MYVSEEINIIVVKLVNVSLTALTFLSVDV